MSDRERPWVALQEAARPLWAVMAPSNGLVATGLRKEDARAICGRANGALSRAEQAGVSPARATPAFIRAVASLLREWKHDGQGEELLTHDRAKQLGRALGEALDELRAP